MEDALYEIESMRRFAGLEIVEDAIQLIGYDFEGMGPDRLYQASDQLWKHRRSLESHLFQQETTLFELDETITLYDLTNTFFEGNAKDDPARTPSAGNLFQPRDFTSTGPMPENRHVAFTPLPT